MLLRRTENLQGNSDSPALSWRGRLRRRTGLTAIEYCFMLSLIMLAVLFAVQHLGNSLKASFQASDTKMQTYLPSN
jgi:Flp pilus assembly pilin Flp